MHTSKRVENWSYTLTRCGGKQRNKTQTSVALAEVMTTAAGVGARCPNAYHDARSQVARVTGKAGIAEHSGPEGPILAA